MDQLAPIVQSTRKQIVVIVLVIGVFVIGMSAGSYYIYFRTNKPTNTPSETTPQPETGITFPKLQEVQQPSSTQLITYSTTSPAVQSGTTNTEISESTDTSTEPSQNTPPQQAVNASTTVIVYEADQPKLIIGDTWKWSNRSETYIGEKDDLLLFTLVKNTKEVLQRYRTKSLNFVKDVNAQGVVTNIRSPHTGMLSFPLVVGKGWTQQYVSGKTARIATYKVTAYEKLLTSAGQLNVFKIEGIDKRDDLKSEVAVKLWYSPKARTIVQSSGIDPLTKQMVTGWNYQLMSYHVQ